MDLQTALSIVRALADGVNPITGEAYPEDSIYAAPRILRALYRAVDLMEREATKEKKRDRLPANFGKPWSPSEDTIVCEEYAANVPLKEIARRHQRTESSCRLRLEKLGKIKPETSP